MTIVPIESRKATQKLGRSITLLGVVLGAIDIATFLVGGMWGVFHGFTWFTMMRSGLHLGYDPAASTAVLIGATAYFERAHVQHTRQRFGQDAHRLFRNVAVYFHHVDPERYPHPDSVPEASQSLVKR